MQQQEKNIKGFNILELLVVLMSLKGIIGPSFDSYGSWLNELINGGSTNFAYSCKISNGLVKLFESGVKGLPI